MVFAVGGSAGSFLNNCWLHVEFSLTIFGNIIGVVLDVFLYKKRGLTCMRDHCSKVSVHLSVSLPSTGISEITVLLLQYFG